MLSQHTTVTLRSATPSPHPLSQLERVTTVTALLTVHTFRTLRALPLPSETERRVCGAFLSLFSEIDDHIDATPSFTVLPSRFWNSMSVYCQQPGHVTQMVRRFPQLLLAGRLSDCKIHSAAMTRAGRILAGVHQEGLQHQQFELLYLYTEACLDLYRASKSPTSHTPRPITPVLTPTTGLDDSANEAHHSPGFISSANSRSVDQLDALQELHCYLARALRLFLREKLRAQEDKVNYVKIRGKDLLGEFSASVREVTSDLPEPLRIQGVRPFLASLSTDSVLRDVKSLLASEC